MAIPKASVIQFLLDQQRDSTGLLNGGKVYFYAPGTSDTEGVNVWLDQDATIPSNNPYQLNANGTAQLYAYGNFRIVVKDSDDIIRMDYDNIYFNSGGDYSQSSDNVSNYGSLALAVAAIGSTRTSLHLDTSIVVEDNLIVPANIVLVRSEGGMISVVPGVTLTFVTAPESPPTPWFYGTGTVTVQGYPQEAAWWALDEKLTVKNLTVMGDISAEGTFSANGFSMPKTGWHYRNASHIDNLGLTAAIASKSLTITLTDIAGAVPSATSPVSIAMRSSALTSGQVVLRYATETKKVVLPSGATLGFANNESGRIYVWAVDNDKDFDLAVSRTADIFTEAGVVTTVALGSGITEPEGRLEAATLANTMYSTTALVGKAYRCIGYIEITTGAVAGEWELPPTIIQLMGPGVHRTGDVIQNIVATFDKTLPIYAGIPMDDTAPLITEGELVVSGSITPTSGINKLVVFSNACFTSNNDGNVAMALFQGNRTAASKTTWTKGNSNWAAQLSLSHSVIPNTTESINFSIRMGNNRDGFMVYVNSDTNRQRLYGGTSICTLLITEYFA